MKLKLIFGVMIFAYVTILYLLLYNNVETALKKTIETSAALDRKVKSHTLTATPEEIQWTRNASTEFGKTIARFKSSTTATVEVLYTRPTSVTPANNTLGSTESFDQIYYKYREKLYKLYQWNPIIITHGCPFPLETPIKTIFINETMSPNCLTHVTCLRFLDELLIYSTDDLCFNFLLGGNGIIYEGLDTACPIGHLGTKSIVVTVVGDSTKEASRINERQLEALQLLIAANIATRDVDPEYQLVPMCCIVPGNNPGVDLYTKVSEKFGHFYSQCSKMEKCKYT